MKKKKILGILLSAFMVVEMIPNVAFATGADRGNISDEGKDGAEAVVNTMKSHEYNSKIYFSPTEILNEADGAFDPRYEYDWGIVGLMSEGPGSFTAFDNVTNGQGQHIQSRYTRLVAENFNEIAADKYHYMSIRADDNDLRGWNYVSATWGDKYNNLSGFTLEPAPVADRITSQYGRVPIRLNSNGDMDINGSRYYNTWMSDYFTQASDTYYIRTFMGLPKGNNYGFPYYMYMSDGGNRLNKDTPAYKWVVGDQADQRTYKRWAVVWYKREKALPSIIESRIDLAEGSNHYDGGITLWTNDGNISYFVEAMDNYDTSYGQVAQWDAGIKELWMGVSGEDVSTIIGINRENENSKMSTTYKQSNGTGKEKEKNSDRVGNINLASDTAIINRGFNATEAGKKFEKWKKGEITAPTLSGTQTLSLKDGDFVTPRCDAVNKQGISVTDRNCLKSTTEDIAGRSAPIGGLMIENQTSNAMVNFHYYKGGDTSSTANEGKIYRNVAIDKTAPVGTPINYDNQTVTDSITLRLDNVKDISGGTGNLDEDLKITKEGCGVKSITAEIYKVNDDTNAEEQKISKNPIKLNASGNSYTGNFAFTDSMDIGGKCKIVYTLVDNLNNSRTIEVSFNREDYLKSTPEVDLVSWDYAEPGTNQRWVAVESPFQIALDSKNDSKYTKLKLYPTSQNLYVREIKTEKTDYSVGFTNEKKTKGYSKKFTTVKAEAIKDLGGNAYFTGGANASVEWNIVNNGTGERHLSNINDYQADSSSHGKKFRLWGDSTVSYNARSKTSDIVSEKDGEILCVDGEAPRFSYEQVDMTTCKFSVKDFEGNTDESGIAKIVINAPSGVRLYEEDFDSSSPKVMEVTDRILDHGDYTKATAIVTDNVGNTKKYPMNFITIDTSLKLDIITTGSGDNARKKLKVTGKGEVTSYPISDNPQFGLIENNPEGSVGDNLRGYPEGYNRTFVGSPKLDKEWLIDDVYNEGYPNVHEVIVEDDGDVDITWERISDPVLKYGYSIACSVTGTPIGQEGTFTRNSESIDFCSGEDRYSYKLYYTGIEQRPISAEEVPVAEDNSFSIYVKDRDGKIIKDNNGNPKIKEDSQFRVPNLNVKTMLSGWYKFEVTMLDFNGNPSGTTEKWFHIVRPAVYQPMNVTVTAVKDVSWEKAPYPYTYELNEDGTPKDGTTTTKFPIGSPQTGYKATGSDSTSKIKFGYMINYNFTKNGIETLDGIDLKYKFVNANDDSEELNITINGKSVETYDAENNSNIGGKNFSKEDLQNKTMFMKHFIPANAEVTDSHGAMFEGSITVKAIFTCKEGSMVGEFEVPLYTVTKEGSAFSDLENDKQR